MVRNAAGAKVEITLSTPEGYQLTSQSMAEIGARILAGQAPAGYQTPATAYGAGFVLELDGCALIKE